MTLSDNIKALFRLTGPPPLSPHKLRHVHAVYGMLYAKDSGDIKALSMNLMHSNTGITDGIYAVLTAGLYPELRIAEYLCKAIE